MNKVIFDVSGTTSACAENTQNLLNLKIVIGNYLRVRGEYSTPMAFPAKNGELPPRARRILVFLPTKRLLDGTTSACAENTAAQ